MIHSDVKPIVSGRKFPRSRDEPQNEINLRFLETSSSGWIGRWSRAPDTFSFSPYHEKTSTRIYTIANVPVMSGYNRGTNHSSELIERWCHHAIHRSGSGTYFQGFVACSLSRYFLILIIRMIFSIYRRYLDIMKFLSYTLIEFPRLFLAKITILWLIFLTRDLLRGCAWSLICTLRKIHESSINLFIHFVTFLINIHRCNDFICILFLMPLDGM